MKRIVTIQDVSCIGKCSLTVALPIISCMGVEAGIIPTAVLSTHTAFQNFTFHDLTKEIAPITEHFAKEHFTFDAIYTGYLGSFEQIDLVREFFKTFKTDKTTIIVDPAMADNGKLYHGFNEEFAKHMASLCSLADVILPNITEACYMLGIPYMETYTEADLKSILKQLTSMGAKAACLTGISLQKGEIGAYAYDSVKDTYFYYANEWLPVSFHGTGDIFSSTVTGALARGTTLWDALRIAVDYTLEAMKLTLADPQHNWYGVNFESAIPYLVKRINEEAKDF